MGLLRRLALTVAIAIGLTGSVSAEVGFPPPPARTNGVIFTSSGTYTPSSGVKAIQIIGCGGGGGGGGGAQVGSGTAASGGAGGGGGGCFRASIPFPPI